MTGLMPMRPDLPSTPALATATMPALDRMLTYRLHRLHKLTDLESQRRYPEVTGLSLADGRCLTAVGQFEPLSVNELAQRANLNKSQASRAAQFLVDQGLVAKRDRAGDGRAVDLRLTPQGRQVHARAMHLVAQRNQEIFGCLSPAEQSQLSALLDRLLAHAEAPATTPPQPVNP